MRNKILDTAQTRYANALTYIEMYHSPVCWRTAFRARKEFSKLTSKTARWML